MPKSLEDRIEHDESLNLYERVVLRTVLARGDLTDENYNRACAILRGENGDLQGKSGESDQGAFAF